MTKLKMRLMDSRLFSNTLLLLVVLLIPIIPFVIFGDTSEAWFQQHIIDNRTLSGGFVITALSIIAALVVDILLPVPSSAVLTFAGAKFGFVLATIIGWCGLTLAAVAGYGIGYFLSRSRVARFSKREEVEIASDWFARYGHWLLAGFRALPVLAEASVLLAGIYRMRLADFWPPVLLANFVIAAIYALLGSVAAQTGWFGIAFWLSAILPVLLLLIWLMFFR